MKRLVPRTFDRKRLLGEATVRPLSAAAPMRARVLDLGQGGVALFMCQRLPTGQHVEITFQVGPSASRVGLDKRDGRVVHGLSLTDGNILGVAFALPLKPDELAVLEADWVRS